MGFDWQPIVIGSAIALSPVLYDLCRNRFPIAFCDIPHLGDDQKIMQITLAENTLAKYLKLDKGSHLQIITSDFDNWAEGSPWHAYVMSALKKTKASVTAYAMEVNSGPKVQHAFQNLRDAGMEAIINDSISSEHWALVDKPAQIWFESKHKGKVAFGCSYTNNPDTEVYSKIGSIFSSLRAKGNTIRS